MREKVFILALLAINAIILILQISGLSISYNEAVIVYGDFSLLKSLLSFSFELFGYNDYALRIPMILLHLFSALLIYAISSYYVTRVRDRLWLLFIYLLLPGVTSSALVVDDTGLMITFLYLFVYLFLRFGTCALYLTPILVWLDSSFIVLFISFILYGSYKKESIWIIVGIAALSISYYLYGFDFGGKPKGHFLDLLALYAAVFSPLVFIYIFYVLYRRSMSQEIDLLWVASSTAFIVSLLLSFRQKIEIQMFAPYLFMAIPLAAQTFLHTYRIRLKDFRSRYRYLFFASLILLIFNTLAVFFNHYLYQYLENPKRHFSYPMHVAKELALQLHKDGIHCVTSEDQSMALRLKFYGITQCDDYRLESIPNRSSSKVTISYTNTPVFSLYVTKVNKM